MMVRHLIKLVWNRKRSNLLLSLEIFISFFVLFAVFSTGIINLKRFSAPMGFKWDNVYSIGMTLMDIENDWSEAMFNKIMSIVREIEQQPEVHSVAVFSPSPFSLAENFYDFTYNGKTINVRSAKASEKAKEVFDIKMIQGRWFEESDDALDWKPVVVNKILVKELFGDEDPIGKVVDIDSDRRIIGVIEEFRKSGRASRVIPFSFERRSLNKYQGGMIYSLVMRVHPGTDSEFEERLLNKIQKIMPETSLTIQSLEETRVKNERLTMFPFILLIIVCASLMFMVALGMIGVFWQAVTTRTDEIGLRRAMGSSKVSIYRQLLFEIVLITTAGAGLAALIVVQLPILGILSKLDWPTLFAALGLSAGSLYLLAVASGLYPAWIASRIQPAAALHYE